MPRNKKMSKSESLAPPYGTPLDAMNDVPADPAMRARIGAEMFAGLMQRFADGLSSRDLDLWKSPPKDLQGSPEHRRVLNDFDDYLLGLFHTYGWRLFMSEGVLQRLAEWEKHGPHLLKRLGEELALRSRVVKGKARHPLDDRDLYEFKEKASEELKVLFRMARTFFGSSNRRPKCLTIADWMKLEIETQPSSFRSLHASRLSLYSFINTLEQRDHACATRLAAGTLSAKEFFYRWFAAATNRSYEGVRQAISETGPNRRPRSSSSKV